MTNINTEVGSYINRLYQNDFNFSRIQKHKNFGELLLEERESNYKVEAVKTIGWFLQNAGTFKPYRLELLWEMKRGIEFSISHDCPVYEAVNHIRRDVVLQKRYTEFKYLSSRTSLSKGLEFDCVIIDMSEQLSAKDFYVAMTRAMKKIYIISDSNSFVF